MFKRSLILCLAVTVLLGNWSLARGQASRKARNMENEVHIIGNYTDPEVGDKGLLSRFGDGERIARPGFKVLQVIDEDDVIGELCVVHQGAGHHYQTIWFNIPTKGLADDKVYESGDQLFEITGTKKYTSVTGASKTVLVAKPIDKQKSEAAKMKEAADAKAAENRAAAEAKLKAEHEKRAKEDNRIWTAASSGKTLKATFAGRIADTIKLKKKDGTVIAVSLDQLSDEDQVWVRNRSKH